MDDTVASVLGSVERRPYEMTILCGFGLVAGLVYALPALVSLVLDGGAMLASRNQAIAGSSLSVAVGAALVVTAKELWDGATWAWATLLTVTAAAVLVTGFQTLSLVGGLVTSLLAGSGSVSLGGDYVVVMAFFISAGVLLVLLEHTSFYLPATRVPER